MQALNLDVENTVYHSSEVLLRQSLDHRMGWADLLGLWKMLGDSTDDFELRLLTLASNLAHGRIGEPTLADTVAAYQWREDEIEVKTSFSKVEYLLQLSDWSDTNMAWLTVRCYLFPQAEPFGEFTGRVFRKPDGQLHFDMRHLDFKSKVLAPVRFVPKRTVFDGITRYCGADVTWDWCTSLMKDICAYAGDGIGYYYQSFLNYCAEIHKHHPTAKFHARLDITEGIVDIKLEMTEAPPDPRNTHLGPILAKFEHTLIKK